MWGQAILIAMAVIAIGVTEQTLLQLLLPTAAVGLVGFFVLWGAGKLGFGDRLSPAIAAVVIGLLARVVALKLGAPQLVVAVSGRTDPAPRAEDIPFHVCIDRAGSGRLAGLGGMLNAGAIVLGVAAGIVLGDNLARPLTKGLASNERRRVRRR